jgi:hypothetical protein
MEPKISHWMKHVRDTQDEEIDCSACLEQISEYVDLELATGEVTPAMSPVAQHLSQCAVCREEYQLLHDLAQLEADGELPTNEELAGRLRRDSTSDRGDL